MARGKVISAEYPGGGLTLDSANRTAQTDPTSQKSVKAGLRF